MRLKDFAGELRKRRISAAVLLTSSWNKRDTNITYFTGVDLHDFSCLVVKSDGKAFFLVGGHEFSDAKRNSMVKDVRALDRDLFSYLKKHVRGSRIGINERLISVREHRKLSKLGKKLVDVSDILMELRQIKTKKEQQLMQKACSIGDRIMRKVVKRFDSFRTEADVAAFILHEIAREGCTPAFEPIVATAGNASDVHHPATKDRLKRGFLLFDFGVRYRQYCSDMSRTIYRGNPSKWEREMYELVRKTQERTLSSAMPGVKGMEADGFARKQMGKLARNFNHGLGHQIGIDIHESSFNLNKRGNFPLREGMAVTIEPGIYFRGRMGIRIEDTLIVTKKGPKRLTRFPKKLIIV